jgi:hypothetical protein
MAQTAIDWLVKELELEGYNETIRIAKEIEREQITNAIMYALDEDGHTGDWKIKFAKDYISQRYENPTHL